MKTALWSNFITNVLCQPNSRTCHKYWWCHSQDAWPVDKLTIASENTKSVNFPQNNVRFIVQVDDVRNYIIFYLFTTRGVRSVKLTMCWNIAVFSGLTIDKKFGLFW